MQHGIFITPPDPNANGNASQTVYDLIGNRPAANSVAVGAQFVATDIGLTFYSNGTDWIPTDLSDKPLESLTLTYGERGEASTTLTSVVGPNTDIDLFYTGGVLTSVTNNLDGWTKTLGYTGDELTSVTVT